MDEKTRVIPTSLNQQGNATPNKATTPSTPPQPAVNRGPSSPSSAAVNKVFQPGETGTVQKKRIITGLITGGTLLGLGILTTSFMQKEDVEVPMDQSNVSEPESATAEHSAARRVSITTDHPVSDLMLDDLDLKDAREVAREDLGSYGIFPYRGQLQATATEEEVQEMTPGQRADYLKGIVTHDITNETVNIDGRELEVKVAGMHDFGKVVNHDDGTFYWYDKEGNSTVLENVSENENGQLVRTDPDTGEVTPFNPSLILKNVDEGVIDVAMYPSNVDIVNSSDIVLPGSDTPAVPVDTGTYLVGVDDDGNSIAGWDTDGDGDIDVLAYQYPTSSTVEPTTVAADDHQDVDPNGSFSNGTEDNTNDPEPTSQTNRQLAEETVRHLADEAGIEVDKIKLHETGDGGFDYKVKGDGGKLKGHLSTEDLTAADNSIGEHHPNHDNTEIPQAAIVEEPEHTNDALAPETPVHDVQDTPSAPGVQMYYASNHFEADPRADITQGDVNEASSFGTVNNGPDEFISAGGDFPDDYIN